MQGYFGCDRIIPLTERYFFVALLVYNYKVRRATTVRKSESGFARSCVERKRSCLSRIKEMGKIRVKNLGDESIEELEKKEAKKRSEAKKTHKAEEAEAMPTEAQSETTDAPKEKKVKQQAQSSTPSKKYMEASALVDKMKKYAPKEAVELVKKVNYAKFNASVELHINTTQKGISGQVTLPHGTGKEVRVAIADANDEKALDALVSEIESGKINFDVLVASPTAVPKLAKVARVLGPRGLMPNPKNGTIAPNPAEVAKKFQGGQVNYKTEAANPIIHTTIGKISFEDNQLVENMATFLESVGMKNVQNVTVKSTMSPAVKVDVSVFA